MRTAHELDAGRVEGSELPRWIADDLASGGPVLAVDREGVTSADADHVAAAIIMLFLDGIKRQVASRFTAGQRGS